MRRPDDSKDWDSNFVPKLKIPVDAYITELVILNKINFKIKKGEKISKPLVPFWRKSFCLENPELKALSKDFCLEITYVKNLLKVFSSETVINYVKEKGIITFIYLPLDKQKTLLYNIFQNELSLIKDKKEKAKSFEVPDSIVFKREAKQEELI